MRQHELLFRSRQRNIHHKHAVQTKEFWAHHSSTAKRNINNSLFFEKVLVHFLNRSLRTVIVRFVTDASSLFAKWFCAFGIRSTTCVREINRYVCSDLPPMLYEWMQSCARGFGKTGPDSRSELVEPLISVVCSHHHNFLSGRLRRKKD